MGNGDGSRSLLWPAAAEQDTPELLQTLSNRSFPVYFVINCLDEVLSSGVGVAGWGLELGVGSQAGTHF